MAAHAPAPVSRSLHRPYAPRSRWCRSPRDVVISLSILGQLGNFTDAEFVIHASGDRAVTPRPDLFARERLQDFDQLVVREVGGIAELVDRMCVYQPAELQEFADPLALIELQLGRAGGAE